MSAIPDTPKTLLDQIAVRGGLDEAKWQEFDRLYRPVIRFFIRQKFYSLVNDYDDISQDVMMRLVRELRAKRYDSTRARFRTYLYAIVYNIAVDYLREKNRAKGLRLEHVEWMERPQTTALETMERQWKESCYEAARKHVLEHVSLPAGYREIYLDVEKGLRPVEIAKTRSVTAALVRQVKHRVAEMIKKYMKNTISPRDRVRLRKGLSWEKDGEQIVVDCGKGARFTIAANESGDIYNDMLEMFEDGYHTRGEIVAKLTKRFDGALVRTEMLYYAISRLWELGILELESGQI